MKLYLGKMPSPLGGLLLVTDDSGRINALDYADHRARLRRGLREHHGAHELIDAAVPAAVATALGNYFGGDLTALDDLVTAAAGSDLQRRVWRALGRIPAGRTTSYGGLARTLGFEDPRAAIDVGAALNANPVAIVVPCHRVIASDGGLKGYAGGVRRKRWLLEHEGALPKADSVEGPRLPGV